ncbi:MAG: CorA family divalent cation transporter [Gammaproteobacteria bacterium]
MSAPESTALSTASFGKLIDRAESSLGTIWRVRCWPRAKLLQEELAGRVAEMTSRNLVILSIVTTVFLPITLITGIFGMNVAGLPGLEDRSAFWCVMLGMTGVVLLLVILLHLKRLF